MSLGSSAEPMGAGSTYFSVVKSAKRRRQSAIASSDLTAVGDDTFLCVDFCLKVKIDAGNDYVGDNV